jgi:hypothetical protein
LGAAGQKKLTGWLLHGGAHRSSRALMRGAARWTDEVRADEAKLMAATSGPEGGRKRLAALRCSRRKVGGVGFSVAPGVARLTP